MCGWGDGDPVSASLSPSLSQVHAMVYPGYQAAFFIWGMLCVVLLRNLPHEDVITMQLSSPTVLPCSNTPSRVYYLYVGTKGLPFSLVDAHTCSVDSTDYCAVDCWPGYFGVLLPLQVCPPADWIHSHITRCSPLILIWHLLFASDSSKAIFCWRHQKQTYSHHQLVS